MQHLGDAHGQGRGHAFKRLVQQQQTRAHRQSPAQRHQFLLTAREQQGTTLRHVLQLGQHLVDKIHALLQLQGFADPQRDEHVFFDRELGHQATVFRHVADAQTSASLGRQGAQRLAIKMNLPLAQRQVPHDAAQGAGFARAIAPDQTHHVAGGHLHGKATQHLGRGNVHMQILQLKHRVHL